MDAGGGFEPPTFGLCDLTHLSVRVGLYLHPRGMLAIQSLRLPPPFRGLGAAMHRKITRQRRWNLRRASDRAIPNQAPGMVGEDAETGWRASLVDEGTVRLSSKGESDRIIQRSAIQIPPQTKKPSFSAISANPATPSE